MKNRVVNKRNPKISRFLYWTPRVASILLILFLSLFSLDVFESASNFGEILIGLLMHNIPSLILLIILYFSWRHELVGTIAFTLAGVIYIILVLASILLNPPYQWFMLFWTLIIAGPAFIIGYLFFLNWKKRKNNRKKETK